MGYIFAIVAVGVAFAGGFLFGARSTIELGYRDPDLLAKAIAKAESKQA